VKKKCLLHLALSVISQFCFSQSNYKVKYNELKEFEGLYEYINHTTLQIAASPVDTLLYAIIDKSKYPLTPSDKDLFLTRQKDKVRFFRNISNAVTGYIFNNDTLKLISKKVFFPKEIWYPRPASAKGFAYTYKKPVDLKDGLKIGNLERSGLDTALLTQMIRKIVDRTYPNVHSVLIIKDGKLLFEEYFYEYTKDTLQELRSATKTFMSALTGIAIDKKYIKSVNERVLSYFPEYTFENNSDLRNQITIKNLLTNQTGLDCDITNETPANNETMMHNSDDWVKYTLSLPMIDTPGGKGMYCSGNTITLGRIIEKETKQPLHEFADQTLFAPLGITKFKWRFKPDKSSAETFCQLNLRPRDLAKFGLLYLNKGNWNGKQIISSEWCEQSLKKQSVIQGVNYGYLWWIKYLDADGVRYYGKAAQGNGGQKIYIWEEQNMVTVITGGNYNTQSPSDELIRKYILPAFNKK
jgi:CubicO group peptidase (beta-lactamase class C family)